MVLCCRKRGPTNTSPDRGGGGGGGIGGGSSAKKAGYQKGMAANNVKQPPDLWIHHDQMELKALEKSQSVNNDGASSSGAMTLPRSIGGGNDYDTHDNIHSNSLDKRTYVPNYMGEFVFLFCVFDPLRMFFSLIFIYLRTNSFLLLLCTFIDLSGDDDKMKQRIIIKPKPITLPVDSKPPRERKYLR